MEITRVGALSVAPEAQAERTGNGSFGELLNRMLNEVNEAQGNADKAIKGFLTGEVQDVHQVVLATEEARLMLELAVQVRNKIIEAYQEISRTQI
ncbi:flagellar hook-basal body complex protein FliE [Thermodesulfitimonas autotrophica]|uniref:flagellar hook-basal body complex protein FliE n=1 Tax=Thermodesulfitimonas autotrophica TaxID=1894989 RepID=UPI002FE244EB